MLPAVTAPLFDPSTPRGLALHLPFVHDWLVRFLQHEVHHRRGFERVVLGLSGGVDSAVVAHLCVDAFGPDNVIALRLPYVHSSLESLSDARLIIDNLGIRSEDIEITGAALGYLELEPDMSDRRLGNVLSRLRMTVLFDQSEKYRALPIGTGNKTERMFGYFTWHADDSPPVNPLGDLFKTQVWELARYLGVPDQIVSKPASADLIHGQTDEADFGIGYAEADAILSFYLRGYRREWLLRKGFDAASVDLVIGKVSSTHWKRHLPVFAMLSDTSINDWYLRPVDY